MLWLNAPDHTHNTWGVLIAFIFIAQNINVILVLLVNSIETKMSYGFETHQREKYKCELRLN